MSPKRPLLSRIVLVFSLIFVAFAGQAQTSWRGTVSTAWANAGNWTNGVPTATVDAIVGDGNFTGTFQPSVTATANCRALTVGGGARNITLTISALLNVAGNLDIQTRGTITHTANNISLRGNWSNTGTYNPTAVAATVVFSGTTQTINNTTSFRRVTVNAGSTTSLAASISVTNAFAVSGIVDPVSTNLITLTGSTFTVNAGGRIRVQAATFAGNYSINPTLNATSVVEYASATVNQTIATLSYGTLTISGGSLKTLAANTTMQSGSAAAGRVNLNAGTLELGSFTLDRGATGGGVFTISNGAQLNIGGTNTFPGNYTTYTLGASSTVLYYGNNQTISAKTYGNLTISGTSGTVTKTFPATAMTIAGNFTSTVGTASSVTYTANAALTITGNVSIGASTTFNGGTATHVIAGNWSNAGVYNGNTGTVRFNGAARVVSGAGTQNFNNFSVSAAGVSCTSANLTVTGNLATTGTGTWTHSAGSTLTMSGTTRTITGTGHSLANVVISGTVSTTVSFPVSGSWTTTGTFNATAGTITFSGTTPVIAGAGTTTFFALQVNGQLSTAVSFSMRSNLTGSGKVTATAGTISFIGTSTVSGTHDMFNVTINGTRLQLGANATLNVAGAFTITAGTLNTTTTTPNTFVYSGSGAQTIAAATYNNLTLATGGVKTAAGNITSNGNFTINSGVTYNASTVTHTIGGNWVNNGTFTASTSTVVFNGALNTTTTGITTFNNLTMNKSTATTTVTLNNNITTNNLTMTNGRMLTGSNSVTITGTRTGNAVILGTITRTHAFAANTAYAFESSFNTVTFTSITGGSITSVTVTVLSAPVTDFLSLTSVNRSYNISVTKTGNYAATLRLHYEDTELNGNVEANLGLWRFVGGSWTSIGKSANDATNNWVQQTGLTDITSRWTFFDGSSTQIWKGTTSSAWATGSNWKSGVVPVATDNVLIGSETFTNQPAITTAVTVKSILFGSAKAVAMTMSGAGALTVTGNVGGDWLADQVHTLDVATRTLSVGGNLSLSNGTAARSLQLSASTGTINVTGSINHSGAGAIVFSGAGALNIGADYNYTAGTFTAGTSTVTYNGTVDQVIAGVGYNDLAISKSTGNATLSNAATVNGNLSITGAGALNANGALDVVGNVNINSGTTLNANNASLRVGGNWNRAGTFNPTVGAVVLNGAGNQTIVQTTFNDLVINKPSGVVTPASDLTINGDLSVTSGTFDIGSLLVNRSSAGGTLTVGDGGTLRIGGASNFPTNYDTRVFTNNSTVVFNGTTAQSVPAETYGNLVLSNGGATPKSLVGDTQVNGDLTVNAGATLDEGVQSLRVRGNWTNNGTFSSSGGSVDLQGTGKSITGSTVFSALTVSGSYTAATGTSLSINGAADLPGTLTAGANTVTLAADVTIDGTFSSDGNVIFSGAQVQNIQFNGNLTSPGLTNTMIFNGTVAPVLNSAAAPTFVNVIVNNTAGITASEPWTVLGTFTVNTGGKWNGGLNDHTFKGAFTNSGSITGAGKFLIAPGLPLVTTPTTINLGSGANFQNTGVVEFGGINTLTVNGTPTAFNDVVFSNTSASGMTATGNLNINGDLTVNAGSTFQAGTGLTHTVRNNILVNGVLNGNTSLFVLNPVDTTQVGGSGTLSFYDVRFAGVVSATSNFNIRRNLINDGSFLPNDATVSFTSTTSGSVSGTAGTTAFNNVSINKPSATLTLNGNLSKLRTLALVAGTLDLQGFIISENATLGGSISLDAGTRLIIGGTNTMPTFTLGYTLDPTSTVEYNGAAQSIRPLTYGHLTLSNAGTKTFSAVTPTDMSTLTNNNSTAAVPASASIRLIGNWVNNGTFTFGNGSSVTFRGTATQSVSGTSVTDFGNVSITNTSTPGVSIESNQNLRGVLTLGSNATMDADGTANTAVLTVMSSADNPTLDGSIASLPSGAAVQGRVTVQRYMTIEGVSGGRIYRYISSPVQSATVADMQNEIPITGAFTGRSTCTGCTTSASVFQYDETVTTGGVDGGYVAFPVAVNTETFQPGRGYAMFVRGNLLTTALWDLRGPINSGTITMPVQFTSSGVLADDGWNLVGNPYPATIDWNAASGWSKTNINGTIYIRDNAVAGGQYATWNGVVGTNGGSRFIAAGQGFWVKAGSASPALSVNENAKVAGTQTTFFRDAAPENLARITLSQGNVRDEAIIHFRSDATNDFDSHADAIKLPNTGFNLSSLLEGKEKLAINSLDLASCATNVMLSIDNVTAGTYLLNFDNIATFDASTAIVLVDAFTGATTDVRNTTTYSFSVTNDPNSKGSGRFTLRFTHTPIVMDHAVTATGVCQGTEAPVEVSKTSDKVTYTLKVNGQKVTEQLGNNGSLLMRVPTRFLTAGANAIIVVATPLNSCDAPVERTTSLSVESVGTPTVVAKDVCQEGSATLTAAGATVGQQYRWYAKADDLTPLSSEVTFTTPNLTKTQTYFVSIVSAAGCESAKVPATAKVVHFEEPVIVLRNDSLVVSYTGKKQWYLDGQILPKDTLSFVKPKQSGTYSVVIPVGSCKAEAAYPFVIAGLESDADASTTLWPNPVASYLNFQFDGSSVSQVTVINMSGQVVGTFPLSTSGTRTFGKLDMSSLAAGVYVVEISSTGETKRVKIVKM